MFKTLKVFLSIILAIAIDASATTFDAEDFTFKILSGSSRSVAVTASANKHYSGDMTVPATVIYEGNFWTVTEIDRLAFMDCNELTGITLPATVKSIGQMAFYGCINLSNITMPAVTGIRDQAFSYTALKSVILPATLQKMFNAVFANCNELETISIPASLTDLGTNSPFFGCTKLASIEVAQENPAYKSIDGLLYTKDGSKLIACPCGLPSANIAPGTATIGACAFKGHPTMTSVLLPASVTSIENYAFDDCPAMTEITVAPDNPKYYDDNGLLYTGSALSLCPRGRTHVSVAEGTVELASFAFYQCSRLQSVDLPVSLHKIGSQAFYGCSSLTEIKLPQSLHAIESMAFWNCLGLTSITIPDNVYAIGTSAFQGCSSLQEITLGEGLATIEEGAFVKCTALNTINVKASTPPAVKITFRGFMPETVYQTATLKVPEGTTERYATEEPWNKFTNIQAVDFSGIEDIYTDENHPASIYDLHGIRCAHPMKGRIYIQSGKRFLLR